MILTGKNRTRTETTPIVILSTIWTDLSAILGHHGEKPATNRLSYGAVIGLPIKGSYKLSLYDNEVP
jgi:hypothetical protein